MTIGSEHFCLRRETKLTHNPLQGFGHGGDQLRIDSVQVAVHRGLAGGKGQHLWVQLVIEEHGRTVVLRAEILHDLLVAEGSVQNA